MSKDSSVHLCDADCANVWSKDHGIDITGRGLDKHIPPGCVYTFPEHMDQLACAYRVRDITLTLNGQTETINVADTNQPLKPKDGSNDSAQRPRTIIRPGQKLPAAVIGVKLRLPATGA